METESQSTEIESKETSHESPKINLLAWYGTIAGLCLVIACSSIFITRAYLANHRLNQENWRPGKLYRLEEDLLAINRDGREVSLGQLRGKVYVIGYQYTDCPGGCLGMAAVMKELLAIHKGNPNFHLVSLSVNPKDDTPEKMNAWVKEKGVDSPKWWFLTGDEERIRKYASRYIKFFTPRRNTDPAVIAAQGEWMHDQRLVIVDGEANVRGFYGVMDPTGGETAYQLLKRDLDMVLHPAKKLSEYPEIKYPEPDPAASAK